MTMNVLALCGSLRKQSYNRMALKVAIEEAIKLDIRVETGVIGSIPHYDADVQQEGFPASVVTLGEQVARADAVLIVSPEYNYSVPGVLKNAIDWLSRLPEQPFAQKPVAIMGASMGAIGTARMQYHLRQILVFLNAHPINKPELMIGAAQDKFAEDGSLHDAKTREMIVRLLESLRQWTQQLGK